jgi:hypothetical protein
MIREHKCRQESSTAVKNSVHIVSVWAGSGRRGAQVTDTLQCTGCLPAQPAVRPGLIAGGSPAPHAGGEPQYESAGLADAADKKASTRRRGAPHASPLTSLICLVLL